MKLFTSVLKTRLKDLIEIRDEQQVFRRNRSIAHATFIIQQVKEKAIEFDKAAYTYFIDMTKAFDRVQLKDAVKDTAERCKKNIIRIKQQLNENNVKRIRTERLSPPLFNLLMDKIIKEIIDLVLLTRRR
ncbi:hypothetical protein Trydic_g8603 [Trypoxylus dichotomus]